MLILPGSNALSSFRSQRLLNQLQAVLPAITSVQARFIHFVDSASALSDDDLNRLNGLLTYGEPALAEQADGVWRSDVWTFELSSAEVNAWLNVRLPKWLANQKDEFRWPADVSDVQVEFHNDLITLGARVRASVAVRT